MMLLPNSKWIMENTQVINNYIKQSTKKKKEQSIKEKLNPSLIFNKYIIWEKFGPNLTLDKQNHFKKISCMKIPLNDNQYMQMKKRKNLLPGTNSFISQTKTRVVVNHGNETVLENSLAFHPYYGFPVIPGSALKGVTRHFCGEFCDLDSDSKKKSLETPQLREVSYFWMHGLRI